MTGEKTQTRRIVNPYQTLTDGVLTSYRRTKYAVGKDYAAQPGRGKKSVARIRITGIRSEPVGDITHADAVAEGFTSIVEFLLTWRSIHGKHADLSQIVWVFTFELVVPVRDTTVVLTQLRMM